MYTVTMVCTPSPRIHRPITKAIMLVGEGGADAASVDEIRRSAPYYALEIDLPAEVSESGLPMTQCVGAWTV